MATGDTFGPSESTWTIEQAVLNLLRTPPEGSTYPLIVYYLADQERVMGLDPRTLIPPPGPSSFQGGVDADTFQAEWFPMLHVNVKIDEQPDALDSRGYGQRFHITITTTAGDDDENVARMNAVALGTAAGLLIFQNGSLGIGARDTDIALWPTPELLDHVNRRQVCRALLEFTTFIAPAFTANGPVQFASDPYAAPGNWPTITSANATINVVPSES